MGREIREDEYNGLSLFVSTRKERPGGNGWKPQHAIVLPGESQRIKVSELVIITIGVVVKNI
jgi:hypothetical protein